MGASVSISNNIYISYNIKQSSNAIIKNICSQFKDQGFMTINSELVTEKLADYSLSKKIETINTIISHSQWIIICISEDTVQSYFQTIEINNILDNNNKNNIIYIMTDDNYTPQNIPYLKTLIKNNKWFLLTDEKLMENIKNIHNQNEPK